MPLERRQIYYRGRVQGVGFRYTAHRLARGRDVTGFVRNLDDGRVELVAEGEPEQLDALQQAIAGELKSKIHDVQVVREPVESRHYPDFSIFF